MSLATSVVHDKMLTVADFPTPGILFRDLTPVFAHGPSFRTVVDGLIEPFVGTFDAVAGLEARGFLLAAAVALDATSSARPMTSSTAPPLSR
jgi:adenine phosphoribosyltransferase